MWKNVNGREVHQLVLPKIRRQEVLKLAHDSEWAGHLAYKKTKQRINRVFFLAKNERRYKRISQKSNMEKVNKRLLGEIKATTEHRKTNCDKNM